MLFAQWGAHRLALPDGNHHKQEMFFTSSFGDRKRLVDIMPEIMLLIMLYINNARFYLPFNLKTFWCSISSHPANSLVCCLVYTADPNPVQLKRIYFSLFFMDHWAKVVQNKKQIRTSLPSMLGPRECIKMTGLGNPRFLSKHVWSNFI